MKLRGLGWLVLLWAVSKARSSAAASSAPSSTAPRAPGVRPPYVDPTDEELLSGPKITGDDLLWLRYATDPDRPGPPLRQKDEENEPPSSRTLTDFEIWVLEPYFPVPDDLGGVTIHNGFDPPNFPAPELLPLLAAKTDERGDIWLPGRKPGEPSWQRPQPLWHRYWLGVLAHELTHRAQIRMGMTLPDAIQAVHEHGYVESPVEVQARWMQRRVLRGMAERARAFYPV